MLAGMLGDTATANMARYALELIPGRAIDETLREALAEADDKARVGIIGILGIRADEAGAEAIAGYVTSQDQDVASAAVTALGQIANAAATKALGEAKDKTTGDLQMLVLDAYLNCADSLETKGDVEGAAKIYDEIYKSNVPAVIRGAALRGMVFCSEGRAGEIIVDVIRGNDAEMTAVAVGLMSEISSDSDAEIAAVAAEVKNLPPVGQVQLITALGNHGSKVAIDAVVAATGSDNVEVRIAAFGALASLGGADVVGWLADSAGRTYGAERERIRETLYTMRGQPVDAAVMAGIANASGKARVELIRTVGRRNITGAVDVLAKTAVDPDRKARIESFKVLREIAGEKDIAVLLDLLMTAGSGMERTEAQRAVTAAMGNMTGEEAVDLLIGKLAGATRADATVDGRASLITLLGQFGGEKAFGVVSAALEEGDAKIKDAAVRSLSGFADARPAEVLLYLARNAQSSTHKILALRGYVRMIGLSPVGTVQMVRMVRTAMELSSRVTEKRLVLAAAAKIPDSAAIAFVDECAAGDAAIGAEAVAAHGEIEKLLKTVCFIEAEGVLAGSIANVNGLGAEYDESADCIVGWQDENTSLSWKAVVNTPGVYEVSVIQASQEQGGSEYVVSVDGQILAGKVKGTGGEANFETVKIGLVTIDRAGIYTVVIEPKNKVGQDIMNLRSIRFVRRAIKHLLQP